MPNKNDPTESTFNGSTKVVKTVKWKTSEHAAKSSVTSLTFDFEGVRVRDVLADCVRNVVIRIQNRMRKHPENWTAESYTIKMVDELAGRSGVVETVATMRAKIDAMPDDDRDALIREVYDALTESKSAETEGIDA